MKYPLPPIDDEDRQHILNLTGLLWPQLAGTTLFVTGATGFYGKWLLESIVTANDRLGTGIKAIVLSRDPTHFRTEVPHLAHRAEFHWLIGDVTDFSFPSGRIDYAFHFATTPAAILGAGETAPIVNDLIGTDRVLRFARQAGAKRLLYASSGAVYGPQPAHLELIPESYCGAPDPLAPQSAYAEAKRMGEQLCVHSGVDCVIARGFSFVGPYLPLTDKFAVGSFLGDALAGRPIHVNSDGSPRRSYLYAADLAVWLLTLLLKGRRGQAYNLGSDQAIGIGQLAYALAELSPGLEVEIAAPKSATKLTTSAAYVPDIRKAREELGLKVSFSCVAGLMRTLKWAKS